MTTVLDRPRVRELATELFPETEPIARLNGIASGAQDHSLVVIENPVHSGLTGFLISEHFRKMPYGEIMLSGVSHYRANSGDARPGLSRDYESATIRKGLNHIPYNFAVAGGLVLPNPSILPYEICFISPDEFKDASDLMKELTRFEDGVLFVYGLVAEKSDKFRLNGKELEMPDDYASLRLAR